MTTIAYRDDVLAGDTQITVGSSIGGHMQKVFRKGRLLYAMTGCSGLSDSFRSWVNGGLVGPAPDMKDGDADANGVLFPGGDLVVWRFNKAWTAHRAPFFAFGSGQDFALGAMAQGATAEEAVRIAAQFDTASGGKVTVLRRDGLLAASGGVIYVASPRAKDRA